MGDIPHKKLNYFFISYLILITNIYQLRFYSIITKGYYYYFLGHFVYNMNTPIYLLAIDNVSVNVKLWHVTETFNNIIHIGHIYSSWTFAPFELDNDNTFEHNQFIWETTAKQTIYISIQQWLDTTIAFEVLNVLKHHSFVCLNSLNIRIAHLSELSDAIIDIDQNNETNDNISIRLDSCLDNFKPKLRPIDFNNIQPIKLTRQTNLPPFQKVEPNFHIDQPFSKPKLDSILVPPLKKVEPKLDSILGKRKFQDIINDNGLDNDDEYFDTHQPYKIYKGTNHDFVIQIY